jgi:hypothetical protein
MKYRVIGERYRSECDISRLVRCWEKKEERSPAIGKGDDNRGLSCDYGIKRVWRRRGWEGGIGAPPHCAQLTKKKVSRRNGICGHDSRLFINICLLPYLSRASLEWMEQGQRGRYIATAKLIQPVKLGPRPTQRAPTCAPTQRLKGRHCSLSRQ